MLTHHIKEGQTALDIRIFHESNQTASVIRLMADHMLVIVDYKYYSLRFNSFKSTSRIGEKDLTDPIGGTRTPPPCLDDGRAPCFSRYLFTLGIEHIALLHKAKQD